MNRRAGSYVSSTGGRAGETAFAGNARRRRNGCRTDGAGPAGLIGRNFPCCDGCCGLVTTADDAPGLLLLLLALAMRGSEERALSEEPVEAGLLLTSPAADSVMKACARADGLGLHTHTHTQPATRSQRTQDRNRGIQYHAGRTVVNEGAWQRRFLVTEAV
eukprot:COSAG05_NODE_626_length_8254_cov_12.820846_11_plen_160_part_01